MDENLPHILRFDAFEIDTPNRVLRRGGVPVELGSRYFDALVLLARSGGELVTKDRFMAHVWRGIPVTDEALTQCIRTLRRALGDDAGSPRYIATVPKHGYRFVAALDGAEAPAPVPPVAAPARSLPSRIAGACTLAGGASGALAGLVYGIATGDAAILALLVAALGTLGGAGVGAGIAAALAWRGRLDGSVIAGGAAGGMAVGALGSLASREGVAMLTGNALPHVTGLGEGALLGGAVGLAVLATKGRGRWPALLAAAIIGALSGLLVHLAGGRFLGGSLWELQQGVGATRLAVGDIGAWFGEAGFGPRTRLVTATLEGAAFVATLAAAIRLAQEKGPASLAGNRPS